MKVTKRTVPLKERTNGENHKLTVFDIESDQEGPHVYVQSSLHGAELQGNALIYHLLAYLKSHSFCGSITINPMANPVGVNLKSGDYTVGRYNPNSGNNWNRNYLNFSELKDEYSKDDFNLPDFIKKNLSLSDKEIVIAYKSFMKKHLEGCLHSSYGVSDDDLLAIHLQLMSTQADYVLDLHTGGVATRWLYAPEYSKDSAKDLLFKHTLLIPHDFSGALDEASFMPWLNLASELKKQNRDFKVDQEAYTLELGSQEKIDLDKAQQDLQGVLNYLYKKGFLLEDPKVDTQIHQYYCNLDDFKTYYAPSGGFLHYDTLPGEFSKKGDSIVRLLNLSHLNEDLNLNQALTPVVCNDDCIMINMTSSSAVQEGQHIFDVMENYSLY
ncbi:MAG: succinylglutamate desuccinylase/aspartoacylase family protein [Candidatus Cloacimonetes bacterium]|nr:succinylglutamate desuccinylase/aspartoacylase family protein [Candidatus Cloacimonadota bacterium]